MDDEEVEEEDISDDQNYTGDNEDVHEDDYDLHF